MVWQHTRLGKILWYGGIIWITISAICVFAGIYIMSSQSIPNIDMGVVTFGYYLAIGGCVSLLAICFFMMITHEMDLNIIEWVEKP